jgi:hypothetical protein
MTSGISCWRGLNNPVIFQTASLLLLAGKSAAAIRHSARRHGRTCSDHLPTHRRSLNGPNKFGHDETHGSESSGAVVDP